MKQNPTLSQAQLHAENLDYIQDAEVRLAYQAIHQLANESRLHVSVLGSSAPRPARIYGVLAGKEEYLFSCNRARRHLSFYGREPAARAWCGIADEARRRFPEVRSDPKGETIIIIRETRRAKELAQWLFKRAGSQA